LYIPRRAKASRKRRGSRTCGWGRVGQHRKSGSKGGHGRAGLHKHKWSWTVKYGENAFGKEGFKRPLKLIPPTIEINVGELSELADKLLASGQATFEEGIQLLDGSVFGFNKVLGRGRVKRPLIVKAAAFSEGAKKKIEAAGGKCLKV